jgi:IS30 family transposase
MPSERKVNMDSNKEVTHLSAEERRIIETGIRHGSTKTAIAKTIGKDNSTVGKEIKLHRKLKFKCSLPRECANYRHCKYGRECFPECEDFEQYTCKRRDRSPGACNGCSNYSHCRFDKYIYDPANAEHEYRMTLVDSRSGYNITTLEAKALGEKIQPLLKQGLSPYAILQAHPEIKLSEKTLYTYIENKVFEGLADIGPMDLRRQVNRKISKKKANNYKKREDRRYLIGRNYKDYQAYMAENPDVFVTQMDTVYNDVTDGPYIQTYKFVSGGFLFALLHDEKTAPVMTEGVNQLETILGTNNFRKYVHVLLTDRGGEFAAANAMETGTDGLRRTRVYYCDPMQSGQKGTLENNHTELRYVLPKECNLKQLGLVDQDALNTVLSHVNSLPIEKFGGKSPFDIVEFMYPDLYEKLIAFGLRKIPVDQINLTPSLLKDRRPDREKKHAGGRKPIISAISPREVSQLTADGLSPKEIAARMGVSIATYYRRFPANKK